MYWSFYSRVLFITTFYLDSSAYHIGNHEGIERNHELKRNAMNCLNHLNSIYNQMDSGISDLWYLWEKITNVDEEQAGSLFLLEQDSFEEEENKMKNYRDFMTDHLTRLINIESSILNIIEVHQSILESYVLGSTMFSTSSSKESLTNKATSNKKELLSINYNDIMMYMDFNGHIDRCLSCSKWFNAIQGLLIPDQDKSVEVSVLEHDIIDITGASPLINSHPPDTSYMRNFTPVTSNNEINIRWKDCLKLQKANLKFQSKLKTLEKIIVDFVQYQQTYFM
ncbi:hypothetical protein ABK040_011098 [Willaertia magna]